MGAGARLADHLTVGYLALNCPLDRVRQTLVNKAAISLARTRVGVKTFEPLYRGQVVPVGPKGMAGVWYQGLRVMGLEGSTLEV